MPRRAWRQHRLRFRCGQIGDPTRESGLRRGQISGQLVLVRLRCGQIDEIEPGLRRGLTRLHPGERALPHIMKTLGVLPLAIGFGEGSEMRQPLGVAIIGGLIASQLLTLLTTPVIYVNLDRLRRRRGDERYLSRGGGQGEVQPA